LTPRSWIERLLGRHPAGNAAIAVHNLLATCPLSSLTAGEVAGLTAAHGKRLTNLTADLAYLYRACLSYCLAASPAGPHAGDLPRVGD
jgi:hypothetical protein